MSFELNIRAKLFIYFFCDSLFSVGAKGLSAIIKCCSKWNANNYSSRMRSFKHTKTQTLDSVMSLYLYLHDRYCSVCIQYFPGVSTVIGKARVGSASLLLRHLFQSHELRWLDFRVPVH